MPTGQGPDHYMAPQPRHKQASAVTWVWGGQTSRTRRLVGWGMMCNSTDQQHSMAAARGAAWQAHLLHMRLLGEGDPGNGVGCDAQLLPVHLALLHFHDACREGAFSVHGSWTSPHPQLCATKGSMLLNSEATACPLACREPLVQGEAGR